jgi:hypothetical protein
MKEPQAQDTSRTQFAEGGALICAIGGVVGFGVSILQLILDWQREALKPLIQYVILGFLICVPFVIGFLIFGWLVRRKRG